MLISAQCRRQPWPSSTVLYLKTVTSLISIRFKMQIHVHGFSVDNCRKTHFNSILKLFSCCLWQESLRTTWTFNHVSSVQNLLYRLKVDEFAVLSTSEFLSPWNSERQPNNVWSGLKHLGTHDLSGFVPFAVSLLCLLMVGTIMSLHAVLLLRASWHEAHLSVGSSCFCDRRHSAAQLIVAVSVENNVASMCFTFTSLLWGESSSTRLLILYSGRISG